MPGWFVGSCQLALPNRDSIDSEGRCPCPAFKPNGIICNHVLEQANRQGCLPDCYDDPMFVVDKHLIRNGKYSAWPNASSVLSWLIYESSIVALEYFAWAHNSNYKRKMSSDSPKRRHQKHHYLKKDFTKERKKSISKKNHWGGENSLITHKIFNEMIYFKSLDYFTSKT